MCVCGDWVFQGNTAHFRYFGFQELISHQLVNWLLSFTVNVFGILLALSHYAWDGKKEF